MKSLNILAGLFSLAVLVSCINARKGPGEYWQDVKKDEQMSELVQAGLVDVSKVTSIHDKKTNCHTSTQFEPRPNISAYNDDAKLNDEKSFTKDFEPRPNISVYNNDIEPKDDKKSYTKDFEPRPNISAYDDNIKPEEDKSYMKEFEPRPNISAYSDDVGVKAKNDFEKDFEPRPNYSIYHE